MNKSGSKPVKNRGKKYLNGVQVAGGSNAFAPTTFLASNLPDPPRTNALTTLYVNSFVKVFTFKSLTSL